MALKSREGKNQKRCQRKRSFSLWEISAVLHYCKMPFVKGGNATFCWFFCWEHYLILFFEVTPNWFYGAGQFVFPKIFNGFAYRPFGRQTAPMQMNVIYNRNISFSHKCTTLRKYSPILIKEYRLFTTDGHRLTWAIVLNWHSFQQLLWKGCNYLINCRHLFSKQEKIINTDCRPWKVK